MLFRSRKIEVVSFPGMNNERLTQSAERLEFLACLKVVSRKVSKGLKRKASLSKGILKGQTAKIFILHLLQLSLQK